jgi:formate hydrogenlyase subunit 3/multisubunit Na+/H+ antiporter MnhD subunit
MMENFIDIKGLFSFTNLTVLPALMIFLISALSVVYNAIFTKNHLRSGIMSLACASSIIAILSVNYIVTFVAIEGLSGLCFLLVLLSKKLKRRLAISYFLIHAFAGVLMVVAIMLNFYDTGSFAIQKASTDFLTKDIIMLLSLAINVASFPFTSWYFRTYQRTDSFSLVLLSAITTKTSFFVLWKIIPGSAILFEIGFITLIFALIFGFVTTNIIKFLLITSVASMGFTIMAVSYHGFLITDGISSEINFQLVWYIASSVFSIGGFLVLYGFITNNECRDNSFYSIRNYFEESGSSLHFVIPAIVFGLCLASFPLTASFIAKGNITKFFVEDKALYYTLKASGIAFMMFAIKLIIPVCYSVEFFRLDSKGKRLAGILYAFVGILMLINIVFFVISRTKLNLFYISVEFFIFIAYSFVAGFLLFMLEFALKVTHAKKLVEVITGDYAFLRGLVLYSAHKIRANYHIAIEVLMGKKQKLKGLLAFSKIPPFVLMSCAIFFVVGLLTKILF